jgi:DNA-binding XRE family transcriptional regulator
VEQAGHNVRVGRLPEDAIREIDLARGDYRKLIAMTTTDSALIEDCLRYLDHNIKIWSRGTDLSLNLLSLDNSHISRMLKRLPDNHPVAQKLRDAFDWFAAANDFNPDIDANPKTSDQGEPILAGHVYWVRHQFSSGDEYEQMECRAILRDGIRFDNLVITPAHIFSRKPVGLKTRVGVDWELVRKISALREQLNMTQEEFAHELGVSVRIVTEWENGRKAPRLATQRTLLALTKRGSS